MTYTNNKNGVPTAHSATNQTGAVKTLHSTTQFTKCWKFIWQSYACEEQDGHAVPMEERETLFSLKPSQSQIDQLRKYAHAKGFKLVSIEAIEPSSVDEF